MKHTSSNSDITDVIKAIRDKQDAIQSIFDGLDIEAGETSRKILELQTSPPSRQEFLDHLRSSLAAPGEQWREDLKRRFLGLCLPSNLIKYETTRYTFGEGVRVAGMTAPIPLNLLSEDMLGFVSPDGEMKPAHPAAILGLLYPLISAELEKWLETVELPFPEVSVMPMHERPAEISRLYVALEEVKGRRSQAEKALATLTQSFSNQPDLPDGVTVIKPVENHDAEILNANSPGSISSAVVA